MAQWFLFSKYNVRGILIFPVKHLIIDEVTFHEDSKNSLGSNVHINQNLINDSHSWCVTDLISD